MQEGILISMDGKVRAIDNIFVVRLWRTIKYEHICLYAYDDGQYLYQGLTWYFEFYNQERLHQGLDHKTPASHYLTNEEKSLLTASRQHALFFQRLTTENNKDGEAF